LTTRQDWIEAGYDALGEGGPDGVVVETIAERLGVSKAGFYHRFDNRKQLLDEIVAHWVAHSDAMIASGAAIADPRRQLIQVASDSITDTRLRRADAWLLLRLPTDPDHARTTREQREELIAWVEGVIEDMGFDKSEARIRAGVVYVGYIGLVADIEAARPTPTDEATRSQVEQLIRIATKQ